MSEHYLDDATKGARGILQSMLSMVKKDYPSLTPIEEGFLIGMLMLKLIDPRIRIASIKTPPVETEFEIHIHIQHPVGPYKVDFAFEVVAQIKKRKLRQWIAIECDGYEFHHLSRQQVTKDKARERKIVAAGYKVLRFSGSEIYKSCGDAAFSAWTLALDTFQDWAEAE